MKFHVGQMSEFPDSEALRLIVEVSCNDQLMENPKVRALIQALQVIISSPDPQKAFAKAFNLNKAGRPKGKGFTKSDIISAYIELKHREGKSLAEAKRLAAEEFNIGGKDVERAIERYWSVGRKTAEGLSDADLKELLRPHGLT